MSLESKRRKSWKADSGVSEIVGNILILMITVVLFSTIIAFVQQMPIPEQTKKVDFSATISFSEDGTEAELTVTHSGGAVLAAAYTTVMVEIDYVSDVYNMSDPVNGLYDPTTGKKGTGSWKTGMSWVQQLTDTTFTSKITVSVIDMEKKSMVWSSQVSGGTGGNAPMILQRYVDSNFTTATADQVLKYDDFTLFVTITDPDGDLDTSGSSILIDASRIRSAYSGGYDGRSGDLYWWNFTGIEEEQIDINEIDGKVIYIYAKDLAGHQTVSTFVMTVTELPTQPVIPPEDEPTGGEGGLPPYLTTYWKNTAGYGVYEEKFNDSIPSGMADTTKPNTSFMIGSYVFVRFATTEINNVAGLNQVELIDVRTENEAVIQFNGSSTADAPFYRVATVGAAHIFECQFSTANLWPSAFTFFFWLAPQQEAGVPQTAYHDNIMIFVNLDNSTITWVPEMNLYKEEARDNLWGSRANPFVVSSGDSCKIWVQIEVLNTDDPPTPSVAEVRISDMTGSSELYGVPPAGNMMGPMKRDGTDYYYFYIDLRLNNGLQWAPGVNAYSVLISKFNDSNEGMYYLSKQVYIQGAGTRADFFVGTSGMASGNSNFNTREYAFYIQNNNLFSSRVLWLSESTPGSNTDYTVTAMGAGDIDGDGDRDLLAAFASSNQLTYFENTLDNFGTWQAGSTVPRADGITYRITWIAFGDVNGDDRDDFAYSNSNNQIVIFNTTYGSSGWIYVPVTGMGWTGPINKIALEDMTGDGKADLVVLANNKITIYDLKYAYDAYLNDQRDELGAEKWKSSNGVTVDFDIADMDYDGDLDILTADTTTAAFTGGLNYAVNVNYCTVIDGTLTQIDAGAVGYTPLQSNGTCDNFGNVLTENELYATMKENATGGQSPGWLSITMKTLKLPKDPDLQLKVVARINGAEGGSPTESFYVKYSIDGVTFIPVISISEFDGVFRDYTYTLPASCMDKAIYIRFEDMLWDENSATPREILEVDHVGVYTDRFGDYDGDYVTSAEPTYTWRSVRAGDIDGGEGERLEVVVARHHDTNPTYSGWSVYRHISGTSWGVLTGDFSSQVSYPGTKTTFYASCGALEENGYFTNLAPTLFDVVDINGDGYYDVLSTNCSKTATYNSYVGFFMNLWSGEQPYWRYFSVKSWTVDAPVGQAKDPWVTISLAVNLTPPAR